VKIRERGGRKGEKEGSKGEKRRRDGVCVSVYLYAIIINASGVPCLYDIVYTPRDSAYSSSSYFYHLQMTQAKFRSASVRHHEDALILSKGFGSLTLANFRILNRLDRDDSLQNQLGGLYTLQNPMTALDSALAMSLTEQSEATCVYPKQTVLHQLVTSCCRHE
jgi:hypothetical protein